MPPAKVKARLPWPNRLQETEGRDLSCPLCAAGPATPLASVRGRVYVSCGACGLAFLDPEQRPSREAELAEYRLHRNEPDDPAYRAFLSRLIDPLAGHLFPGACGIDYGCGPGPTISVMMEERGFPMRNWDPFFHADATALAECYDFITCSEAAEHFHDPAWEFRRLNSMLRPGAVLGIMTSLLTPDVSFADWHYIREISHVCFYRPRTMDWIAQKHEWSMLLRQGNVVIFRKG